MSLNIPWKRIGNYTRYMDICDPVFYFILIKEVTVIKTGTISTVVLSINRLDFFLNF